MRLITIFLLFIAVGLNAQAPNLEYVTDEGVQNLSENQGKVIYLSFWASWCKPCIQNFKKYQPMREQLAAEGVQLLNISIDKDPSNWDKAIEKYDFIIGENGLANDINKVMQDFNITKTPDYHIINKRGEFVFLSDDYDRDIVAEFRAWVAEEHE